MLEATDDMLTIEPWPRVSMPGRNAWIIRKQEVTLIENAVDQSCNEQSNTVPEGTIPAQLNSTSIVGRALASARIALTSVTSNGSFSIASSVGRDSSPFTSTSVAMTRAPSEAIRIALARPMPAAAAVTSIVLPSSLLFTALSTPGNAALLLLAKLPDPKPHHVSC